MVLLHWLVESGFRKLTVCHFNHGLRGKESDEDESFVRETASALELECISERNDSRAFADRSKQSLETAARECRYRFFARIAREKGCRQVVLAHHADDQVETVLINLFRGTGLKGLGGMTTVSHRVVDGIPFEVIRPFLGVTRGEVDQYRKEKEVVFREDATNSELIATRNRVRHELLPLARDIFQRDPGPSILRLSEIAGIEYSSAQFRASRWLSTHQDTDGSLLLKPLRQLPPAELHHILHLWLKNQEVRNCGFQEVKLIAEMVQSSNKPAKVNLPGDRYARRRAGVVFVTDRS